MIHPWDADHELDADGARARIEAAFPSFRPRRVEYFDEGWDFRMFLVDGAWLFRIPKRAGEAARLGREVAVLHAIADRLPVPVPRFEYVAGDIAGYRMLEGVPLSARRPPANFARDYAAFLTALHETPGKAIAHIDLENTIETFPTARWREDVRRDFLAAGSRLDDELRRTCERHLASPTPPPFDGPACLIHNDIYPEHVLLSDDGARIAGVLDWGDISWGDPAADFGVTAFFGGPPLLHETVERYGGDAALEARALEVGWNIALGYCCHGTRTDKPFLVRDGRRALARLT